MNEDTVWSRVRSSPLTRDELRLVAERAQDCSSNEAIHPTHSTWELRKAMWDALARAAFACEALLARDELDAVWGDVPPAPKRAGG